MFIFRLLWHFCRTFSQNLVYCAAHINTLLCHFAHHGFALGSIGNLGNVLGVALDVFGGGGLCHLGFLFRLG